MASASPQTYVLVLNSSDLERISLREFNRPLYIHTYTDLFLFSFLIIVSFITNTILATTLTTNRYLQQISSYVPILGLTLTHLFDALFNGVVSLTYMSRAIWDMGYAMCAIHNFCTHLTLGLVPLLLATTAVDRYVCLNYSEVYRVWFTCVRHRIIFVVLLLVSALFAVPYLTPVLTSRPFPARMSCSGSITEQLTYVVSWTVFIIAIPLLVAVSFVGTLGHTLWLDHREKRRVQSRAWLEAKGIPLASGYRPPLAHHEVRSIWVWITLSLIYMLCSLPYVIHSTVHQLSWSLIEEEGEHNDVCMAPFTDLVTSWFRYLATAIYPAIILVINEDVRHETWVMVSRWKVQPSSMIEETTSTVNELMDVGSKSRWMNIFKASKVNQAPPAKKPGNSIIPVLFPSNIGLQLRCSNTSDGLYSYAWCDQLDFCCVSKPSYKETRDDSGYVSLRQRSHNGTDTRKRPNNEMYRQISAKRRELRINSHLPQSVTRRANNWKSTLATGVPTRNKAPRSQTQQRTRASSLERLRRNTVQANRIHTRSRKSKSLDRFPTERRPRNSYQKISN